MRTLFLLSIISILSILSTSCVHAAPPDRWDVSIQASAPHNLDIWRGESLDLRPRFLSYGTAWNISTSATVTLFWSTNNFASSPWATNGTLLAEAGRVSAIWTPACDAGAATYQYFIGVSEPSGLLYRARGTIRMQASPGFVPTTAPLPVWDGWTNGYIYASYAALLSSSNALAAGQQATSNALTLALQAEATRALQAEASAVATAQAALAAGLTGASNYADRATAAGLASGTAARALSASLLDQSDSQAWVTVAAGTATLWRVETTTNYITYLRCVNAGSADINGLYYAAASPANMWIHTATAAFVFNDTIRWLACVNPNVYYRSGNGDSLTTATWTRSYGADPLPVFSFTNIYTSITNRYPLAGIAEVAAASNLAFQASAAAAVAATNSVDPVARASAASKPSYTDASNIATTVVSAYAAPSFPVYDYGLRTNVVFVLSNSVLYLYER